MTARLCGVRNCNLGLEKRALVKGEMGKYGKIGERRGYRRRSLSGLKGGLRKPERGGYRGGRKSGELGAKGPGFATPDEEPTSEASGCKIVETVRRGFPSGQ